MDLSDLFEKRDGSHDSSDPITFRVHRGKELACLDVSEPQTRWDAYNDLWARGELPTKEDLALLPPSGMYELYSYFKDFQVDVEVAVDDGQEELFHGCLVYHELAKISNNLKDKKAVRKWLNDPDNRVFRTRPAMITEYLEYCDMLDWELVGEWKSIARFLDRLNDEHFESVARRMR